MYMNVTVPTWFICTECGEAEKVDDFNGTFIPDGWYIQRNDKSWDVYCPCITPKPVEATLPEKDGTGYARGGMTGSTGYYSTTTNPTIEYSFWTPLKTSHKNTRQEKLDAALAEMDEEKAEQEARWRAYAAEQRDCNCDPCRKDRDQVQQDLKDFGKKGKDE